MYLPRINQIPRSEIVTDVFRGYVNRLKVQDGCFNSTTGVTLEEYPVLASRKPRGSMALLTAPQGMTGMDGVVYVDNGNIYIGGTPVVLPEGLTLSATGKKQLVGMGAYVCIFPDHVYINTADPEDCGRMDAHYDAVNTTDAPVTISPCKADGTIYEDIEISESAPEKPGNGDYWMDTSGETHVLKVYSAIAQAWTTIPTVYARIQSAGIDKEFEQYDGVTIAGIKYTGSVDSVAEQADALNGDRVIYGKGTDFIVVQGLIDIMFQPAGAFEIERNIPQMDFVIESENRLWGCKYGNVDGKALNELYACKLGDFKNWRCYMGLSTDSYAVSLGSNGAFTGAITYQSHPTFFKEGAIHKVYGSAPSNYQVVTDEYKGVHMGSADSLAIVGTNLYYKSRTDVCVYDGSAPQGIGEALGEEQYVKAVGGSWDGKYVISMQDEDDDWHTFVYDTQRGMWVRDGDQRIKMAASVGEELYYVDGVNTLWCASGKEGIPEAQVEWEVVTGVMGWEHTKKKRVRRYNIRLRMEAGSTAYAYLQYDSDGTWHRSAQLKGNGKLYTQHMFVIPRRCDHLQLKLSGQGQVEILSISRLLEEASDL